MSDSFWPYCAGGVELSRPAALPLEAASHWISGKLSAGDPKQPVENLTFDSLKRWHKNASGPVIWLAAAVFLFVWVVLISSILQFLAGGYERVVSDLPSYAYRTGSKLAILYLIALAIYFLVRVVSHIKSR